MLGGPLHASQIRFGLARLIRTRVTFRATRQRLSGIRCRQLASAEATCNLEILPDLGVV